jgi:hypothetical protein
MPLGGMLSALCFVKSWMQCDSTDNALLTSAQNCSGICSWAQEGSVDDWHGQWQLALLFVCRDSDDVAGSPSKRSLFHRVWQRSCATAADVTRTISELGAYPGFWQYITMAVFLLNLRQTFRSAPLTPTMFTTTMFTAASRSKEQFLSDKGFVCHLFVCPVLLL